MSALSTDQPSMPGIMTSSRMARGLSFPRPFKSGFAVGCSRDPEPLAMQESRHQRPLALIVIDHQNEVARGVRILLRPRRSHRLRA